MCGTPWHLVTTQQFGKQGRKVSLVWSRARGRGKQSRRETARETGRVRQRQMRYGALKAYSK